MTLANKWPEDCYVAIVQTQFSPKAQKVYLALPNGTKYEKIKEAMLGAYEVIPEVHRKKNLGVT